MTDHPEPVPASAPRLWPQVMLDLETLSSEPNAPIIQIGLCAFDIRTGEIGPDFGLLVRPDFKMTPPSLSTVCWWLKQSDAARQAVADCEYGVLPSVACFRVSGWIAEYTAQNFELWAMPPSFDVVILENTFRTCDLPTPWHYAATRDLRTLESIAGMTKADRVKATVAHDAREDARAQALTAISYFSLIRAMGPK